MKFIIYFISVTFLFSCQNDTNPTPTSPTELGSGTVSVNGQSYPVKYAYFEIDNYTASAFVSSLTLSNLPYSQYRKFKLSPNPGIVNYTGIFNTMGIWFTSKYSNALPLGNYSFNGFAQPGYSTTSNFSDSHVEINQGVINGVRDNSTGTWYDIEYLASWTPAKVAYCQPSTASIVNNGNGNYTITYSVKFAGDIVPTNYTIVTAQYTGKVETVYFTP